MQSLTLAAISVIAILTTAVGGVMLLDRHAPIGPVRLVLGLVPAAIGAFVVLVLNVDLIPDGPDEVVIRLVVIGVTVVAVVGTWYRAIRT